MLGYYYIINKVLNVKVTLMPHPIKIGTQNAVFLIKYVFFLVGLFVSNLFVDSEDILKNF